MLRHRHGARRFTADVGMMRAVGDKADDDITNKDRRDNRDIRQMGATEVGVINHQHICRAPGSLADQISHGKRHTPEMHGDVRCLADQLAILTKERAGEIQPVFDIRRKSSPAQYDAHLITNGGNPAGEKL